MHQNTENISKFICEAQSLQNSLQQKPLQYLFFVCNRPTTRGWQPGKCPPKFSKTCLVVKYNNKLQSFALQNIEKSKLQSFFSLPQNCQLVAALVCNNNK